MLKLFAPGIETEVVPFDQIIPQVLDGKYEAGLIIHEGQLTYSKAGLQRIVDLGKWWLKDHRTAAARWAAMRSGAAWAGVDCRVYRERCATAFSMPSIIAKKRWPTPCSSPAISTPSWPTSLWACT